MTQDQRALRVAQNLAKIDQILNTMDVLQQVAEWLRDETDALVKEGTI